MDQEKDKEIAEMSFLDHLEALRWHLVRSSAAVLIFCILAFVNKSFIFDTIILAPKRVDFWTYLFLCDISKLFHMDEALCITEIPFTLINIDMSGQFSTHIIVSVIAGIIVAFPYIVWELWRFIKPALHQNEKKYSRGLVFFTSLLFALGVLFGYYFIAPMSINFLGSYRVSADVLSQISLGSYITTLTTITLAAGLIFELPILVYFLSKIGVVTPAFMRKYRKHSLVVMLILAAIITPPDISSQILVCIPLLILYEISIYISAITLKNKK